MVFACIEGRKFDMMAITQQLPCNVVCGDIAPIIQGPWQTVADQEYAQLLQSGGKLGKSAGNWKSQAQVW